MASLDSIVSVAITATTTTPSRVGFGTPMFLAYHTTFPELSRTYSSVAAAVADGFVAGGVVARGLTAMFAQNPAPTQVKVGRRASAHSQSIRLTPSNTTENFVVKVSVVTPAGVTTIVSRANGPAETAATIATALTPLLTAIAGVTATDNVGSVQMDADAAGDLFDYRVIAGLDVLDETADPGLAADIAAVDADDSDWYGLALDSNSKTEVAAAASTLEALTKIFVATSADEEVLDDTAGNIAETIEAAAYSRTALIWNRAVLSFAGAAWLGKILPTDPGSATWALKTLAGITVDKLTDTQITSLESNNANHYTSVASVNITRQGQTGDGDFIDVQRTIDALTARIQEDVFGLLVNLKKLPYTDASVSLIKATIRGAIRAFQDTGALSSEVEPTVTAPLVADVSDADRANRVLPTVAFSAQLSGAIHKLNIAGTLTI